MKSCDDNERERETGEERKDEKRVNEGEDSLNNIISDIHSLCFWLWTSD